MASPAAAYPKTRRIRFRFGDDGSAHKYFVEDDIVYSQSSPVCPAASRPEKRDSSVRCSKGILVDHLK